MSLKAKLFFIAAICLAASHVAANTLHVPSEFDSIESAIAAVQDGDIIEIAGGTYFESSIFLATPNVTIRGVINPDGSPAVTIDGQGTNDILLAIGVVGATGATVENITFTGSLGNAVWIYHHSPTIRNCVFTGNVSDTQGAAVWSSSTEAVFESCRFTGNSAGVNGNIVHVKGVTGFEGGDAGSPIFRDCLFENNTGYATVMTLFWNARFEECTFRNNAGDTTLYCHDGTLELQDSLFCENEGDPILGPWTGDGNEFQETCPIECAGDLNGDLQVDIADFSAFLVQFGQTGVGLSADLDLDLDVDVQDFSLFLVNFGNSCQPLRSMSWPDGHAARNSRVLHPLVD